MREQPDTRAIDVVGGRRAQRTPQHRLVTVLGPAFVAAVAYVDPGNFAANFAAGAEHGTLLLWVLISVNLAACVVQFLAAKLGYVTARSISELVGERLGPIGRWLFWLQATLVVIATDIAEVIGGAVGLYLLVGLPLPIGGVVTGVASLALLLVHTRWGQEAFERMILVLLLLIPMGFLAGLVLHPPMPDELLAGLVPRFAGVDTVLLAVAMLGATVMPHVIYLHSTMARDRREAGRAREVDAEAEAQRVRRFLSLTRVDVGLAMAVAGSINCSMLILAASAMRGSPEAASLEGIFRSLSDGIAPWVAVLFALGLTISGFASTAVGGQAGASVMDGLLPRDLPLVWRRVIVIAPAVALLMLIPEPTGLLVLSQALLAFGIPFALIPLVVFTNSSRVMGEYRNGPILRAIAWAIAVVVVLVDLALVVMSALGVA